MKPILKDLRSYRTTALRAAAAATAMTILALAACSSQEPPPPPVRTAEHAVQTCADSIASSPPGATVLTSQCRQSPLALTVLSAAQEKYENLRNLTTELSTKLDTADSTVAALTLELQQNAEQTSKMQDDLFDTHIQVNAHATDRIHDNLETQSLLEESSSTVASQTISNVTTRLEIASQLERDWLTRYTDLDSRYTELRDIISQQATDLLAAQLLLDQERAEFDRTLATAILEATREERGRLSVLRTQAQSLHDTAQATLDASVLRMADADALITAHQDGRTALAQLAATLSLQQNAATPGCAAAWQSLRSTVVGIEATALSLDHAWSDLQASCSP